MITWHTVSIIFIIVNNRILLNEHSLFLLIQECRDNVVYLAPNLLELLMFLRRLYALMIIIIKIQILMKKSRIT
jgi:hypothetical protein